MTALGAVGGVDGAGAGGAGVAWEVLVDLATLRPPRPTNRWPTWWSTYSMAVPRICFGEVWLPRICRQTQTRIPSLWTVISPGCLRAFLLNSGIKDPGNEERH